MNNFGELPFGEIPEPLKFVRPFKVTTLSNGIRVCTEKTNSSTTSVGVFVGGGSRNEDLETSGAGYALSKMLQRGTNSQTKEELYQEIEGMGAQYTSEIEREHTFFGMKAFKNDVGRAVNTLGNIICNSNFNREEFEGLKEELSQEHEANHTRYQETLLENVHFNTFREHMLGQPKKGDRDNVFNLDLDHLVDFHNTNYFGDNIVIVGHGDVDHATFVDQVEQNFQSLKKSSSSELKGTEKPIYIPALMFIRDDEMYNSNVGVFYDAPSIKHDDYYGFLLLKHIFGSYRINKHAEHINDVRKQYNSLHSLLGDLPDVTMSDCHYFAYSDAGIWGNYFFGNEVFTRQMNYCGVGPATIYSHYMTDVEVFRARNALYNQLMKQGDSMENVKEIGNQMLTIGRRVPRSEIAKRAAHIDNYHLKHLCNEWFYDAEPSFTNWGPIETVSAFGSYKYFKINTLSTVTNAHQSLYT